MSIERALLVHAGALGDFVMSLCVVSALRASGARRITVLGKPDIARLAVPGGGVDDVLDIETGGFHHLFMKEGAIPAEVATRLGGIELAVNMLAGKDAYATKRLQEAGVHRVIDIDPSLRPDWNRHVTQQWLLDLSESGLTTQAEPPLIRIEHRLREDAAQRLAAIAGNNRSAHPGPTRPSHIAILHPGSGSRRKCWPADRFMQLADRLARDGWRIVFLLGPVEAEWMTHDQQEMFRTAAPTISNLPLCELPSWLAAADLFVGNDSGVSHLSAAVGTPTVAIFGPTHCMNWGPRGPKVHCVGGATEGFWPSVERVAQSGIEQSDLIPSPA